MIKHVGLTVSSHPNSWNFAAMLPQTLPIVSIKAIEPTIPSQD
jgi:hypothetical protein